MLISDQLQDIYIRNVFIARKLSDTFYPTYILIYIKQLYNVQILMSKMLLKLQINNNK